MSQPVEGQSAWQRFFASRYWTACKSAPGFISFFVGLPAAWLALDQVQSARENALKANDSASIARRSVSALEGQVAAANRQAETLKEAAEAAKEAARQSQRLAAAAESSASYARQQIEVLERQAKQLMRARLEITKLEGRFAVGELPAQFLSVQKVGIGTVKNLRLLAKAEIVPSGVSIKPLKDCKGAGDEDVLALESKYYRRIDERLTHSDYSEVKAGTKKFVVHGSFCYDDENEIGLMTNFCGEYSYDYGPSYCRNYN